MKIPFGKPDINEKEIKLTNSVLKSGLLVHGGISVQFEDSFRKFTNSQYALSVSSCTAGMHLIYYTLGIGKGDEVIVPSQTHVATAHAVELTGAKAIFVDCNLKDGNIDVNKIESKISKKTKAICVMHFLGVPVNIKKVLSLVKKYKLKLIEDCALSLGSKINNKHTGLFGDAGVFSFYPVKHITTGEGGMIILKDKKLYSKLKLNKAFGVDRSHNMRTKSGIYDVLSLGFNYRMSEIHAAIGLEQMKKLDGFIKKRVRNFNYYLKLFEDIKEISLLNNNNKENFNSNYCFTVILNKMISNKRDIIKEKLQKFGIGTSVYYPHPVPLLKYYKNKYKYKDKDWINSKKISYNSIAFPVGPHIGKKEIEYIAGKFKYIINNL